MTHSLVGSMMEPVLDILKTLLSGYVSGSHVRDFRPGENSSQLGQPEAGCSAAFDHGVAAHPDPARNILRCEQTSTEGTIRAARPALGIGDRAVL